MRAKKTGGKKRIFCGGRCSSHPPALLKKKGGLTNANLV